MQAVRNTERTLSLAKRTVHIKMYPTAKTFDERREVLRVLEQFGEIAMFRSLKYFPKSPYPNAFFAIFSSEAAALSALNQSPLRYRLTTTPGAPPLTPSQAIEASVSPLEDPPQATSPPVERIFELHINPTKFSHERFITSPSTNPLYGPYKPVKDNRSYIAASLSEVLPKAIWAPGMRDWETDSLNLMVNNKHEGEGMAHKGSMPWRIAQRERKRAEREGVTALSGLMHLRRQWEVEHKEEITRQGSKSNTQQEKVGQLSKREERHGSMRGTEI